MNKTEALNAMGTECTNIRWSWHSTHRVSGAVVCHAWQHPNWLREIDGKRYFIAAYRQASTSGKRGRQPLLDAVLSDAPLYCILLYPNKGSKRIMDKCTPSTVDTEEILSAEKYGKYVYAVDRDDGFTDEYGNIWMRLVPGFMTLTDFNRQQSAVVSQVSESA